MNCDHDECTGKHSTSLSLVAGLCPAAHARRLERQRDYRHIRARWDATEKGRARNQRYKDSAKGMLAQVRDNAKRRSSAY